MPKVSIIVPIYNSEKHLEKTLTSLQNQTLIDLEVIMVDDGSKDRSASICRKFKLTDKRFKYYYQQNQGVSIARNYGLSVVTSKYICFCDADDIPNPEMYEKLYLAIEQYKSDMVMCDYFSERDSVNVGFLFEESVLLNSQRIREILIPNMIGHEKDDNFEYLVWGCVWRCIFRKDIIDNFEIRFPKDTAFAEDLIFTLRYLIYTNKLYILNKVLYVYNDNASSVMNSMKYYKENLFLKRKSLMKLITIELEKLGLIDKCRNRMHVTFRKYILECVGNSCIKCNENSFANAYRSLRKILNDQLVCKYFQKFETKNLGQFLIYFAIRRKLCLLILIYYRIRLGRRQLI